MNPDPRWIDTPAAGELYRAEARVNPDPTEAVQRLDDAWSTLTALAVGHGTPEMLHEARTERSDAVAALLDVLAVRDQQIAALEQDAEGRYHEIAELCAANARASEAVAAAADEAQVFAERLAVRDQQLENALKLLAKIVDESEGEVIDVNGFCNLCGARYTHKDACLYFAIPAFLAGLDVQEAGQ